ncbi:Clp protease N-terminal domain-containing protein [Actinomadura sp. SCN-SB]|uniref:ClpX C4-type zinc finger protein n=1 Tax=Actinomadura sp. SCN-SB TaxID=3373092 RepID=UPI0037517153
MDGHTWSRDRLIAAVTERAGSDDPLVLLETAVAFAAEAGETTDAVVDHFVGQARRQGLSWTVIGARLGVSKQAARQKFADRIVIPATADAEALGTGDVTIAPKLAECLRAAQAEADSDDSLPSSHHLLAGLLHAGIAAGVLDKVGVTREKIRQSGARLFEPATAEGPDGSRRRVVGDGAADNHLAIARHIAARRGQNQVRTEHLLFALATDEAGSARRVLDDLGADLTAIKKELNEVIPPFPRRRRPRQRKHRCDPRDRACAFCGCTAPGRPMVAGPGLWICADCVALATSILADGDLARHAW